MARSQLVRALALAVLGCIPGAGAAQNVDVFAPGVVTVEGESLYRGSFSPDGAAFYFFRKVTEGEEDYRIFVAHRQPDGTWGDAERVDLGGEHSDLYPTLSPDGRRMVFASYRPTPDGPTRQANLWYADRTADGWSEPVYMAAPSDPQAYNPGPTYRSDGYVYYKWEVWGPRPERRHLRTRWTGTGFSAPEPDSTLEPFEDWRDDVRLWNGVLSPDGRLMVLEVSVLDPGTGRARPTDLWLSRRGPDGWTEPRRLPDAVNSETWENFVVFSPDGRDLLFGRGFSQYLTVPVLQLLERGEQAAAIVDIRGTWELGPEGRIVSIYDLQDYMPDGSRQLNFFEPTSGRLRTLHAADTGWVAGPAWFAVEPVELQVRVAESTDGRAERLAWEEGPGGNGTARVARRIHFPRDTIRFTSQGDGLEGTLVLPPSAEPGARGQPLPAIVLVHGSGRASREIPRPVAELFARAGVAAFVYDKRGVGASEGDFSRSTVAHFAADAAAAVHAVRSHPAIDGERVGVMVASEGGLLLPDILERNPELALIVCRVCPVLPGGETSIAEARGRLTLAGMPESVADSAAAFLRLQQRYARSGEGYDEYAAAVADQRGSRWASVLRPGMGGPMAPDAWGWTVYRDFIQQDPWAVYERFDGPVLGVFGALDERIPQRLHADRLATLLDTEGHPASQVWVLNDATHGLLVVEPDGGRRGPFRRVPAGWHDRLVEWVAEQLDPG